MQILFAPGQGIGQIVSDSGEKFVVAYFGMSPYSIATFGEGPSEEEFDTFLDAVFHVLEDLVPDGVFSEPIRCPHCEDSKTKSDAVDCTDVVRTVNELAEHLDAKHKKD